MVKIDLNKIKRKVTLLLTTTVYINEHLHWLFQRNSDDRKNIYLKAIKQWLEKTDLSICLVENSGYEYNELNEYKEKYKDRFEVIGYNEKTLPESQHLKSSVSKGQCELFALNYAYDNSKLISESDFIIKITGRYFIPELENYLNTIDLTKYYCLHQNDGDRCELVGVNNFFFKKIFKINMLNKNGIFTPHMESYLSEWRKTIIGKHKVLQCPLFEIEETKNGGHDEPMVNI